MSFSLTYIVTTRFVSALQNLRKVRWILFPHTLSKLPAQFCTKISCTLVHCPLPFFLEVEEIDSCYLRADTGPLLLYVSVPYRSTLQYFQFLPSRTGFPALFMYQLYAGCPDGQGKQTTVELTLQPFLQCSPAANFQ